MESRPGPGQVLVPKRGYAVEIADKVRISRSRSHDAGGRPECCPWPFVMPSTGHYQWSEAGGGRCSPVDIDSLGPPKFDQLGGRFAATGDSQCCLLLEQVFEQFGVAGHRQVQMFANLAGHRGRLFDEVAPMSRSKLQLSIRGFPTPSRSIQNGRGRSVLGIQIGFVGLVPGIGRDPVLLGCERMDDACFKTGFGKRPFRNQVVAARPLYRRQSCLECRAVAVLPESAQRPA